jgi:putative ABC transport system permease protein
MSYSVSQRTQEIGIRMALGAAQRDVLRLVAGQGMLPAGIGIVAGIAGALWLTRCLSTLLFSITATDPLTFATLAALLAGIALVATWLPARIDPMTALRWE